MISAKVIADSIGEFAPRLTTMELRYQRFIHAECKTHRVIRIGDAEYEFMREVSFMHDPDLSRNASSSRATPVHKLIEQIRADAAKPIHWGANRPGMQATEELTGEQLLLAQSIWQRACNDACDNAEAMAAAGAHKQIVNRILEPFAHISVVVTATEWQNFFDLRCHPDAQPEIQALACAMRDAMEASQPVELEHDEWHLPYVDRSEFGAAGPLQTYLRKDYQMWEASMLWDLASKVSAARCARVSYLTHDGKAPDIETDLGLFDRLVGSRPLHASPLEHQGRPDELSRFGSREKWVNKKFHGNLNGWVQHRKLVEVVS